MTTPATVAAKKNWANEDSSSDEEDMAPTTQETTPIAPEDVVPEGK